MAFDTELLKCAEKHNLAVRELPVVWSESSLESKSSSLPTALEMLSQLTLHACRHHELASSEADGALLPAEGRWAEALLHLGQDSELNALIAFCSRYYHLVESVELRKLGEALRSLLRALVNGALTEGELQALLESCDRVVRHLVRSRRVAFYLGRYPQTLEVLRGVMHRPRSLRPVLCFLLGSAAVARILPGTDPGVPPFYAFLHGQGAAPARRERLIDVY
jgi:hypothetical protein